MAPEVALNDKGQAIVAWYTNFNTAEGNVYVAERSSRGVWSGERQVNSTSGATANNSFAPRVALNDQGQAVITWYNLITGSLGNIYVSSRNASGEWSAEQQINASAGGSANNSQFPQVALNDQGLSIVTWQNSTTNPDVRIYVSEGKLNGSWSFEQQINTETGGSPNAGAPKLALNNQGEAIVTWYINDGLGNFNIYVSERSSSEIWSSEQQINATIGGSSDIAVVPQVSLNDQGQAIVTWYSQPNFNESGNIYISERTPSETWSAERQINSKTGGSSNNSQFPQVALNDQGQAIVSWNSSDPTSNAYVSIRNLSGEQWSAEQQINSESGGSSNNSDVTNLGLNNRGESVVAWSSQAAPTMNVYTSSFYNIGQSCLFNTKSHTAVSTLVTTPVSN